MLPEGTNVLIKIVCYEGNGTDLSSGLSGASWGVKYLSHQSLNAFLNACEYFSSSSLSSGISSVST